MSISNWLENTILNMVFNDTDASFTTGGASPTTVYVKLHVGDPGETGASNPASNNTTRKAASFTTSTTGTLATDADLEWTAMTAEGSQVSHISIWDDVTAGNCLWTGSLTSAKTIGSNDTFKIPSGSLTISLD